MASLMVVKSWTVALFDAHAGGLALGESLRRMLGPLLCEATAIATAFVVLGRRQVIPTRRIEGNCASRWFAWCYLVIAFVLVLAIPAAMVLWGTIRGFGLLMENFVLSREILVSLLFAAGASTLAGLAVFWLGVAARGRSIGSIFCKVILVAAVFAGLFGSLVLSLTVLVAVQLPGLISLRDTPVPLVFTLGLVLLPMALVLKRVLELTAHRSALHLTTLMQKSRAVRELTWKLSTSGKFWVMVLLFVWAYWDLTASAILAPIGMTPVTVRLYNLMHYGQIAALSAMTCAAFAAPIFVFLLAFGTRRWWAPP
jgi:ABC-type Fe3+ transport system permease subunit